MLRWPGVRLIITVLELATKIIIWVNISLNIYIAISITSIYNVFNHYLWGGEKEYVCMCVWFSEWASEQDLEKHSGENVGGH